MIKHVSYGELDSELEARIVGCLCAGGYTWSADRIGGCRSWFMVSLLFVAQR